MLKIIKNSDCVKTKIKFDEYVPFTVEFDLKKKTQLLYWRVGNGSSSLAEIGINKDSGEIQTVTLTSIERDRVNKVDSQFLSSLPELEGIPLFDLGQWSVPRNSTEFSEYFVDDFDSDLSLEIGQDYISLSVRADSKPVSYIRNGNVIFGVEQNSNLSTIIIKNILNDDIKILNIAVAV